MTRQRIALVASVAFWLLAVVAVRAATDLNEVSAFMVFPSIQATDQGDTGDDVETFVTITNAGPSSIVAHVSFINGDRDSSNYCAECNFDVPLTPNDTETLVFIPNGNWTDIVNLDAQLAKPVTGGHFLTAFGSRTCAATEGFLTVGIELPGAPGLPRSDNVLVGDEVVVNYTKGYAYSVPAIPFQGNSPSPGRTYGFGMNYEAFPRVVAGDFLAPTLAGAPGAELVLFTLNFKRRHPPESDCSVIGYDANENPFSSSLLFGCWDKVDLCDVDPEFCYPNLGLTGIHSHGWFSLNCSVESQNPDEPGAPPKPGNVHGVLIQRAATGTVLRRGDPSAPALDGHAAWARPLFQSRTQGAAGTLVLEGTPPSL